MARSKKYEDERPRINLALDPDVYEGARTLAHYSEMSLTAFINETLRKTIQQNASLMTAVSLFKKGLVKVEEDK